jgi:type II secretory pathway pseudopilin PulG
MTPRGHWRGDRGLSLVEATIVLGVVTVLAAALAPSIGDYLSDARQTTAKQQTEAIGSAILQLLRDTGSRCLRAAGTVDCTVTNRVDLLVTAAPDPVAVDTTLAPDITLTDPEAATTSPVNWLPSASAPVQQDLLEDQLIENDNATPYTAVSFIAAGGPRMKLGWRGAYLTGAITADPWNTRYQVNTVFLTVATNAVDTSMSPNQLQEGLREAGWSRDVLVLSAGANRIVETSFGGTAAGGVNAGGDDVIYVLTGSSR